MTEQRSSRLGGLGLPGDAEVALASDIAAGEENRKREAANAAAAAEATSVEQVFTETRDLLAKGEV